MFSFDQVFNYQFEQLFIKSCQVLRIRIKFCNKYNNENIVILQEKAFVLQEKYELRRRKFDRSVAVPFTSIETANFVS